MHCFYCKWSQETEDRSVYLIHLILVIHLQSHIWHVLNKSFTVRDNISNLLNLLEKMSFHGWGGSNMMECISFCSYWIRMYKEMLLKECVGLRDDCLWRIVRESAVVDGILLLCRGCCCLFALFHQIQFTTRWRQSASLPAALLLHRGECENTNPQCLKKTRHKDVTRCVTWKLRIHLY